MYLMVMSEWKCISCIIPCDFTDLFLLQSDDFQYQVAGSQQCPLQCVSTLVHFFWDLNHVTLFRKGPKSDAFVILGAHVISTRLNIAPPPPPNPLRTDTEGVCYQRKKDQCALSSHFQLTGSIQGLEKRATNKHPLFSLKQDVVCCCTRGSDVIVMVHPLCDLWAYDSLIASHQLEPWFCFIVTPTHLPSLHKHIRACIHELSPK